MTTLSNVDFVTPNWFSLMRVPLRRGRVFTPADQAGAAQVIRLGGRPQLRRPVEQTQRDPRLRFGLE